MFDILQQDSPRFELAAFLRAVTSSLSQMHAEQCAHGGITPEIGQWLDESGMNFDAEKFRATAVDSQDDPQPRLGADVRDFVKAARCWISGKQYDDVPEFKAENHADKKLPLSFMKLLEGDLSGDTAVLPSMADFVNAHADEGRPTAPQSDPTVPVSPPPSLAKAKIRISFRNGTVGKPYEIEPAAIAVRIADSRGDDPAQARITYLDLPHDCGLHFNEASGAVSGIPTRALEEVLLLDYAASSSSASIRFEASLLINPDPDSLWKDIEPPPDAPYQKASLDHKEFNFPGFRVVAASRRGRSHANKGDFRDDDFAVGYAQDTGWLVVVVADGAGSAKYSRQGSYIACTVCRDWLVANLNLSEPEKSDSNESLVPNSDEMVSGKPIRQLLYDAARLAHFKIKEEVESPSDELKDPPTLRNYDTTLILLVSKRTDAGQFTAAFSIGDGGAGVFPSPDDAMPLTHADGGEHAGQTTFLTIGSTLSNDEENLSKRYKESHAKEFLAALAMTDGITDPKFPNDAAFADPQCWKALWTDLEPSLNSSESLLEWMNFFSPGNHDDRTIVALLPSATHACG